MTSPKGEADNRPRRFYKDVDLHHGEDGWGVRLDGRALRTPEKHLLATAAERLSAHIADEWRAQGERIDFASMSMTRLANVAIDRTPATRVEIAEEIARYAETDLVCHLADFPEELSARQDEAWRPMREWAAEVVGVQLISVEGVLAARQPEASIAAARDFALSLDDFRLTGLAHGTAIFGSAVLGMAVAARRLTAADACERSLVDELFQIEQWGLDGEAERRLARLREDAAMLDRWFDALG